MDKGEKSAHFLSSRLSRAVDALFTRARKRFRLTNEELLKNYNELLAKQKVEAERRKGLTIKD